MVLSHTSGFPNWRQKGRLEFLFDPGERFGYSGEGFGLERSSAGYRAWHWGDNDDSKAFFVADPRLGDGLVYFSNSYNGLSIVGDLLDISMDGTHPLLDGALLSSYPAHDSLGEAQLGTGLRHEGLANYRRSLELNPENENARRILAEAGSLVD
jgi:hypothetical protein